ncbi:helix-hairpin-helix domain-containing protein [Actinomadura sp. 6N118]|uniref:helix-hairpin-helix domain-containing protein n=1 Tax=Actinomadura sp. 6N118 TaxID=3375151 RepID=UPI0037A32B74
MEHQDDLTRIDGIGPKRQARFRDVGVSTYKELADHSPIEIIGLLAESPGPSPERAEAWRRRARELAEENVDPVSDAQRSESFVVRVLLNEDDSIQSTTVKDARTGDEERWPGWKPEAVIEFVEGSLRVAASHESTAGSVPAWPTAEAADGPTAETTAEPSEAPDAEVSLQDAGDGERADDQPRAATEPVAASLALAPEPLHAREPFTINVTLHLVGSALTEDRLAYSAVIIARPVGSSQKVLVARKDGVLSVNAPTIDLVGEGLPPGSYRLDAAITLRSPEAERPLALASAVEGLMFIVPAA